MLPFFTFLRRIWIAHYRLTGKFMHWFETVGRTPTLP